MSEKKEYIERGALIKRLNSLVTTSDLFGMGVQAGFSHAITEANAIPAADVEPVVRGEWKTWEEQFPGRTTRKKNNLGVFCSVCQLHADNMTSYCPNCGAHMERSGSGE